MIDFAYLSKALNALARAQAALHDVRSVSDLVAGEALVDLRFRNAVQAFRHGIHRLPVQRQADHIVHADAGALDDGIPFPPRTPSVRTRSR